MVYCIDDRLPLSAPGEGILDFIGFRATLRWASRATAAPRTSSSAPGRRQRHRQVRGVAAGYGLRRSDGAFAGYPVLGPQHRQPPGLHIIHARRIPTSRCTDKEGRRKKKNLTYGPML